MTTFRGILGCLPMMQHALAGRVLWRPDFSIGDPTIDAQDRAIFQLVGVIDDLWAHDASIGELCRFADESSRILGEHFRYEERMLSAIGYPGLREHAAEHGDMLADLASIRQYLGRRHGSHSGYAGLRLANFMLGVTVGHIHNADGDYRRYIGEETDKLSTGCA